MAPKALGLQRKRTPPPPPLPPRGPSRPPPSGPGREGRAPVAMGTHGAQPPERDAGGGAAADPVGDAVARWRLRGREMRSERAPPGTLRGCFSLRRRRRHCGAESPPATAPQPSPPASQRPPAARPAASPRARGPTTPLRLPAPSEV
ncbi:5-Hydroxytryptamine Receptor 3E [Manis pentadactyla]|nr:5-Hydroxytryptamine Receptor 3E [Manis pentadactyla]